MRHKITHPVSKINPTLFSPRAKVVWAFDENSLIGWIPFVRRGVFGGRKQMTRESRLCVLETIRGRLGRL